MTSRRAALSRRVAEAEIAAHELWIERIYAELGRLCDDQPDSIKHQLLAALRGFIDALESWPSSTTAAQIEAALLARISEVAPDIGAELKLRMEHSGRAAPPLSAR